jgi:transposase
MSIQNYLEIQESAESLRTLMNQQENSLRHAKIQALYLLKLEAVETIAQLSTLIGRDYSTVESWLDLYQQEGIEGLLRIKKPCQVQNPEDAEILTLAEIQQRYPRQWVLIVEPDLDEEFNVIRGKVLAASPDQDEAYSKLSLRKGKLLAIEYTGPVSDDLAVMV